MAVEAGFISHLPGTNKRSPSVNGDPEAEGLGRDARKGGIGAALGYWDVA